MIPLQVRMQGWMRYRDEQVADFTGASLISICGENGAGKSAIFDAMTFALYGRHRLGAQHTEELISQDQDLLSVSFDFESDGKRFRVERSRGVKPGSGASCLYAWDEASDTWTPVPGTDKTEGLQTAVARIVKLSEAAFTSSYLLPQDEATQFIDLQPAKRFESVRGLIGLEAYERLAKAAIDAGRLADLTLKDRRQRLTAFESVDAEALTALAAAARQAAALAQQAGKQRIDAELRAADAERHASIEAELAELADQIAAADALIAARDAIERDFELYQRLATIVATVTAIQTELAAANTADVEAATAREELAALDLARLEAAQQAAREAVQAAAAAVKEAARRQESAGAREREAHDFAVVAGAYTEADDRLGRAESRVAELTEALQTLPALEREATRLAGLRDLLPYLDELARAQGELDAAEATACATSAAQLEGALAEAEAETATLAAAVAALQAAAAAAQAEDARLAADLRSLQGHLDQRMESAGEAECSRCGQPIDAAAAQAEVEDLQRQVAVASEASEAATACLERARCSLDAATQELKAGQEDIAKLQADRTAARYLEQQLAAGRTAVTERGAAALARAPADLQDAIATATSAVALLPIVETVRGAAATAEPTQRELSRLIGLQGQLASARDEQAVASEARARAAKAVGKRLDEVAEAATAHAAAQAALGQASAELEKAGQAETRAQAAEAAARAALDQAAAQQRALETAAIEAQAKSDGHTRTAARMSEVLPEQRREAALADPDGVLAGLANEKAAVADAPDRLESLRRTEAERQQWLGEQRARQAQLERIPVDHRVAPAVAAADLTAAVAAERGADETARRAEAELATLKERVAAKAALTAERDQAERRYTLLRRLAVLLGRNGLQGVLVIDALNTITSHANSFLDRLTGGSLQLHLQPSKNGDAVDLLAIDSTCMREPRRVQALSGSQRFRCAVALAFGIGQYAGAGGMRSIMIDEGFGGLDEAGQRQMVEELKNLAHHMDKVIVVSHLDVFRDPDHFPHRVVVEKRGNASVIRAVG
jgi:DNA repair exonuclease SbcCD ATPase subunit